MQKNIRALHQRLLQLAKENHFVIETIHKSQPVDIIGFIKRSPIPGAPTVYLSSGIHGDEPAGPYAIAQLLEDSFFSNAINWYIVPILNPRGLELGTRENFEKIDLNRDYKAPKTQEISDHIKWLEKYRDVVFDLTLTLHEDWESPGFYAYAIVPPQYPDILSAISKAVSKVSPINLNSIIEGRDAQEGFITHTVDSFKALIDSSTAWPEAFWLMQQQKTPFHFTFETPSGLGLEQRIQTHVAAVKTAVERLMKHNELA